MAGLAGTFIRRMRQTAGRGQRFLHGTVGAQGSKVVIGILGGSVVAVGVAMIVLPGPAFLVIPAGLGILATEFVWARRWMKKGRAMLPKAKKKKSELVKKVAG